MVGLWDVDKDDGSGWNCMVKWEKTPLAIRQTPLRARILLLEVACRRIIFASTTQVGLVPGSHEVAQRCFINQLYTREGGRTCSPVY